MSYLSTSPAGGSGSGTVTQVNTGAGLTGGPITATGTIALSTPLSPLATLAGNSLKVLRVNAGETAVEYATIGGGDVVGPASAVDGQAAVFDSTTGKLIKVFAPTAGSVLFAGVNGILQQDNANFFYDDTNNRLIVGANATDNTTVSSSINVVKTGLVFYTGIGYGIAGASGAIYAGNAANGTPGSPTAVLTGSTLVSLSGRGYDGTAWTSGSQGSIAIQTAETWGSSARGTNITFNTTPIGSTTNTGVGAFSSEGNFVVGSSTPQLARFGIISTRSAAFPASGGINFTMYDNTFTDTSSSGVVASMRATVFGTPTLAASSSTTYTAATTLYIAASPIAGTNVSITQGFALWVNSGISRFGGSTWFGGALQPVTNDGAAIGNTSFGFSDLFLASGGVINWNAGNATLTHSAGLLTSNVPLSLGTSNALTAGTIELGAATDTTIARSSAGVISVEGVVIPSISSTNTLTNKRITKRTGTTTSSATPTINRLFVSS